MVTTENVGEYVMLVTKHMLLESVRGPLDALLAGIEDVFPVANLKCFGPEELQVSREGVCWLGRRDRGGVTWLWGV